MKPEKGFYYHYKHDSSVSINDYAYEIMGIGVHTENKERLVVYKPLYINDRTKSSNTDYFVRPFEMFTENVEKDGKTFPRFQKITDSKIIEELVKIRDRMYK